MEASDRQSNREDKGQTGRLAAGRKVGRLVGNLGLEDYPALMNVISMHVIPMNVILLNVVLSNFILLNEI
jgi:hypothetical protein